MKLASVEAIARALDVAGVRYLLVGGFAVIAHGYGRLTMDLDLVIELSPANIRAAFDALTPLGYRPRQPVTGAQFADPAMRKLWIETKNMKVLNLQSDQHPETTIDIFVIEPFDFEEEYSRALPFSLVPGTPMRVVCLDTLVRMKEAVGRPRDLDDAWHLKMLRQELGDGPKK
jgi:hypothetical protein